MTEDDAIKLIKEWNYGDQENHHMNADCVLCDFLRELGYNRLVDAFDEVDKWYA